MNILSLFDGMSCGQQALNRCGFTITNYFASEIDKHAIKVTQHNYPNTIQLGSVVNVNGYELPKIDLLIGGSPCQSFSFAGKRKGMSTKDEQEILTLEHYLQLKQEGFEFEGQSYLFWEYMRLLNELRTKNPNVYFLLENVEMGEKWELVLSRAIGVKGIHINSALLSAQNRKRIYWTNIGMQPMGLFGDLESIIEQPKDKGILLKDILETEVDQKYFLSEKAINKCLKSTANENMLTTDNKDKSGCLIAGYYKTPFDGTYVREKQFTGLDLNAKSRTIRNGGSASATNKHNWDLIIHNLMPRTGNPTKGGTGHLSRNDGKTYCLDTGNTNAVEIIAMRGRPNEYGINEQQLEKRKDNKSNSLTSVQKDNLIKQINFSKESGGVQPYQQNRIYDVEITSGTLRTHKDGEGFRQIQSGKGATIPARAREDGSGQNVVSINSRIRRLTPIECERLQTVEDNYTSCVSDSQRYKMLGNGWTIDVICHILNYLKYE